MELFFFLAPLVSFLLLTLGLIFWLRPESRMNRFGSWFFSVGAILVGIYLLFIPGSRLIAGGGLLIFGIAIIFVKIRKGKQKAEEA